MKLWIYRLGLVAALAGSLVARADYKCTSEKGAKLSLQENASSLVNVILDFEDAPSISLNGEYGQGTLGQSVYNLEDGHHMPAELTLDFNYLGSSRGGGWGRGGCWQTRAGCDFTPLQQKITAELTYQNQKWVYNVCKFVP